MNFPFRILFTLDLLERKLFCFIGKSKVNKIINGKFVYSVQNLLLNVLKEGPGRIFIYFRFDNAVFPFEIPAICWPIIAPHFVENKFRTFTKKWTFRFESKFGDFMKNYQNTYNYYDCFDRCQI